MVRWMAGPRRCARETARESRGWKAACPFRALSLSLALLLGLFGLAACSGKVSGGEHEPLTVCNINGLFSDDFIAVFQGEYPEVAFDAAAYRGSNGSGYAMETLEQGDIPDIYLSTYPPSPEAQREYLIDLSGYDFISNYSTTMLNDVDNEGGIYLLPSCFQMVGISYNKTLMQENGWDVPNSFEELVALIPLIEAAGYEPMRCLFDLEAYPFNYFFNIINTEYFHTADGAQWKAGFSSGEVGAQGNAELLAGAEYFKRWVDEGLIKASDLTAGSQPRDAFLNGECVFFLSLGLTQYESTADDGKTYEFDVIPWLSDDGETNTFTVATSRYFGLSKRLLKPGNEQKLEDALKLLEYLSTREGQEALVANASDSHIYTSSLAGMNVPEESPFFEWAHLVESGHTIQLAYVGWEDLIIPMAQDIEMLVSGRLSPEELLAAFDETYAATMQRGESALAYAQEDFGWEDTLRLCAIVTGSAVQADAALVTRGGYNASHEINDRGVSWYFYEGPINLEILNVFRPKYHSIAVFEMTGAQIKEFAAGGFDLFGSGDPFPYTLAVKGDGQLEDDVTYRLAVGTKELTDEALAQADEVVELEAQRVYVDYLLTLGSFGPDDITWE